MKLSKDRKNEAYVHVIVCVRGGFLRNDFTRFHKVKESSDAGIMVTFQVSVEEGGNDGLRFGWSWIFVSSAWFPKSIPVDIRGMLTLHTAVLQCKRPWSLTTSMGWPIGDSQAREMMSWICLVPTVPQWS